MEEKYMVNDILEDLQAELEKYEKTITESQNIRFRQTIQQIRNNKEAFQYELFKVAQIKGYCVPEKKASQIEINEIKNRFNE